MLQQGKGNMMNDYGNGFSSNSTKTRGVAIPIPTKVTTRNHDFQRGSSGNFFSSSDDSSAGSSSPGSPAGGFVPLSSSHQGFHSANSSQLPLNVYGTSPRTSVMFNYYNSPKGIYNRPHHPLIRTRSTDTSQHCKTNRNTIDFSDTNLEKNFANEATGLVSGKKKSKTPAGISAQHFQQLEDPRPRAWSESDKNRSNNSSMNTSRMSALRKLKMKLGQKGGLKRQKSREEDERNRSAASITSLEKVEEGRQLGCVTSPKQSVSSKSSKSSSSSVHQEHETRKKTERRVGIVKYPIISPQSHLPQVEENPEDFLIYQRFLEEHTCYDLMPTSSKLVVLDTRLEVRKAFHALVENSLRCAPLWDNETSDYVGLLTVSDFVNILLAYHSCPNKKLEDLENQKISCWRKVLNSKKTLIHLPPESSIFAALKTLTEESIRRLAIMNPHNGDIFHVINHRRILHFLFLFMNELPKPNYMKKTVKELGVGTRGDVSIISENSPVIDALKRIASHKITGLPVIDSLGRVSDVFTKTDVLVLAGEQLFYDLSITVKDVISLHSTVDVNEEKPTVVRTMPGSPALVRRKIPPKHSHPQSSTPINALSNHPFLRTSSNGTKNIPSPLVTSQASNGFSNPLADHPIKDKHGHHHHHHSAASSSLTKPQTLGKGDSTNVLSPPSAQPLVHRHRHLSSHLPRSSSISSHLVTVTMEDTLEFVVTSVVTADVPQAVIVDERDHVKGVISVGDILRFMVYPTKDGAVVKNTGDMVRSLSQTEPPQKWKFLDVNSGSQQRPRAISDDTDLQSACRTQFSSEVGKVPTHAVTPPSLLTQKLSTGSTEDEAYFTSASPVTDTTNGDGFSDVLSDLSSLDLNNSTEVQSQKGKLSLEQPVPAQILVSGEKIKRL